ncbi:MAG: TonB family protein [Desulfobacterales bacterium]
MAEKAGKYLFIIGVMLGMNLFLFVLFPHYVIQQKTAGVKDPSIEDFHAFEVLRTDLSRPEKKPPEQKKQPETKQPKKHKVPENVDMPEQTTGHRPKALSIDPMDLQIHPRLSSGIKVSAPAAPRKKENPLLNNQYGVGEVDTVPMAMAKTPPVYPYKAKRMNLSGKVSVKFLVGENGHVSEVEILSAEPENVFDKSVIQAVSSWRFKPGKISGQAVDTWMKTTIIFDINEI